MAASEATHFVKEGGLADVPRGRCALRLSALGPDGCP